MKIPTPKLVVCRETLQVPAEMELVRAAGAGNPDGQLIDTAAPTNGRPNVGATLPAKP